MGVYTLENLNCTLSFRDGVHINAWSGPAPSTGSGVVAVPLVCIGGGGGERKKSGPQPKKRKK